MRESDGVSDGERETDEGNDADAGRDCEPDVLRETEPLAVVLRVMEPSRDGDAVKLRDCDVLAVREPGMLALSVTERDDDGVCVVVAVKEGDAVTLFDMVRLVLTDELSERL